MDQTSDTSCQTVKATVKYLAHQEKRPVFYIGVPKSEQKHEPPSFEKPKVVIRDAREALDRFSLEKNGFEFRVQDLPQLDFLDRATVVEKYYRLSEEIVAESTNASRVIAFDHNVRDYELAPNDTRADSPVRFVHNDYTENSAPQRVIDLMGSEAKKLLNKRYSFINVWRPIRGPVLDFPLGFIDSNSLSSDDFIESELRYMNRVGHIYSVINNPAHRWYFLDQMKSEEILLLKCYDSETENKARYTAHASFKHPTFPENSLSRRSIETRTIAFF